MNFFRLRCGLLACTGLLLPGITAAHTENLELQWKLSGMKNPESVVYDAKREVLYVSNMDGSPLDKNGTGFIARVTLQGELEQLKWVQGLHAPKGMAIVEDRLYVSDVDALAEIDIPSGKLVKRHLAPQVNFLNDVAATADGWVYVSDMKANILYRLETDGLQIWLQDAALNFPNGLYAQPGRLVIGCWGAEEAGGGAMLSVSLKDLSIRPLGNSKPIGRLDGVEQDREGDFYVTDWMAGKLLHVSPHGEVETLLELQEKGSADIEYIPELDLLLLPMMLGDDQRLLAYRMHAAL